MFQWIEFFCFYYMRNKLYSEVVLYLYYTAGILITNQLLNTYDFPVASIYGKKETELFSLFNNGTSLAKIRPGTNRTLVQHLFIFPSHRTKLHTSTHHWNRSHFARMQYFLRTLLTFLKKAFQRQYITFSQENVRIATWREMIWSWCAMCLSE